MLPHRAGTVADGFGRTGDPAGKLSLCDTLVGLQDWNRQRDRIASGDLLGWVLGTDTEGPSRVVWLPSGTSDT